MKVNPRKYGPEREGLLASLGRRYELDYTREVLYPGCRPVQIAFQLVGCGADLLAGLRYPDAIPTADRRVAKKTAKAVAKSFRADGARLAAIFLAESFAAWYIELMTCEDDPDSADVHENLRALIQEFFPLDDRGYAAVDVLRAEYKVMRTHDMTGRYPSTGYHMALLDPEHAEGRDVDEVADLVEAQERYASRYLRLLAERHAIATCIGAGEFSAIEDALFLPSSTEWGILEYDVGDLSWWTHIAQDWQTIGERALGDQDPVEPPMRYLVASELAEKTLRFLESPRDGVMPEVTQAAGFSLINELAGDNSADRDLALDALIIGYEIRAAEMTSDSCDHLDRATIQGYAELLANEATPGITIAGAALQLADSASSAFSGPQDAWLELRSWATNHAIQRAWRRYGLGLASETTRPTISVQRVATAVDRGYALRFAENELQPAD